MGDAVVPLGALLRGRAVAGGRGGEDQEHGGGAPRVEAHGGDHVLEVSDFLYQVEIGVS